MHAYHLAVADIGRGEMGKNNAGPWLVEQVRPFDGTGSKADSDGAWCASWESAKYMIAWRHACELFEMELRLGFKTTRSALTLGDRLGKCGIEINDLTEVREGDTFYMPRDGGGHTGFCRGPASGLWLPTLEGNVGKYPALVQSMKRKVSTPGLYVVRYGG